MYFIFDSFLFLTTAGSLLAIINMIYNLAVAPPRESLQERW